MLFMEGDKSMNELFPIKVDRGGLFFKYALKNFSDFFAFFDFTIFFEIFIIIKALIVLW